MKVTSKIELNTQNIAKLESSLQKVLPKLMEAFKTEVEDAQVIPRDKGDLMSSGFVVIQGNTAYLAYSEVYARRLYFNPLFDFRIDQHANARGKWLDEWIYGPKKEWLTNSLMIMWKKEAGGIIK